MADGASDGNPYSGPIYPVTPHASASGLAYVTNPAWPAAYRTLYVSLFGALIAMLLWNSGARRIGALNAVLLANLTPVVTFATRAVEGVVLSAAELAGAALVVGALGVNSVLQRRERLRTGLAST